MKNVEKRMIIGAVIFAIGAVMHFVLQSEDHLQFIVFLIGYVIVGYDVVLKAIRNIGHGQMFDEHLLMVVATIGAFIVGEYPEGMAVMLFFQVGEWFERRAVGRTRESISALTRVSPASTDWPPCTTGLPFSTDRRRTMPVLAATMSAGALSA